MQAITLLFGRSGTVGVIVCVTVLLASWVVTIVISVTEHLPMTLLGQGGEGAK